jgi:hypothetical protein
MSVRTDPQIFRQSFSDNVEELIGLPTAPVLMKMFSQESKGGDSVRIDGLIANEAIVTDTKLIESRGDFESGGKLFADWLEIQTPYTGSTKQGSFVSPQTIEASDTIGRNEDVLRNIDIKSPLMTSLASAIYKKEDLLAITAAQAPEVLRELDRDGTKANVAMPASQEYETANVGFIDPNDLSLIDAKFRDEYVNDEKFLVVNPTTAALMKNNSRDYFQNVDFIGRMGALADGVIEMAESFKILVVPQVPANTFFAFCQRAITCNTWTSRISELDVLPTQRHATQLYTTQDVNAVRNDDLGVVHGTIKTS